ncbi:MAG: UDP-N-acetylglucosamine--N-acetylmuramyl-(pentapeptide) pyrophosphoryl-undecaprenol N-acetylglucosamine transferase [Candidatus Doudnabacteria bacterium]
MKSKSQTIFLLGGQTGGPITPLLALAEYWQKQETAKFIVLDVKNSAGQTLAKNMDLDFKRIITGKFRRYWWGWQNIFSPVLVLIGLLQSAWLIAKYKPSLVIGAGGYVEVPVIFVAWLFGIKRVIHQQDAGVSLSNALVASLANVITTSFKKSTKDFPQGSGFGKAYLKENKVYWTGNPARESLSQLPPRAEAIKKLELQENLPVLLVFGGGSGSLAINNFIWDNIEELNKIVQVVHIVGGKQELRTFSENLPSYKQLDFVKDMSLYYASADYVLCRAGLGTLSELAVTAKPAIIIPMPNTHQTVNSDLITQAGAGIVLDQADLDPQVVLHILKRLMFEPEKQKVMVQNLQELLPLQSAHNMYTVIKSKVLDVK